MFTAGPGCSRAAATCWCRRASEQPRLVERPAEIRIGHDGQHRPPPVEVVDHRPQMQGDRTAGRPRAPVQPSSRPHSFPSLRSLFRIGLQQTAGAVPGRIWPSHMTCRTPPLLRHLTSGRSGKGLRRRPPRVVATKHDAGAHATCPPADTLTCGQRGCLAAFRDGLMAIEPLR